MSPKCLGYVLLKALCSSGNLEDAAQTSALGVDLPCCGCPGSHLITWSQAGVFVCEGQAPDYLSLGPICIE